MYNWEDVAGAKGLTYNPGILFQTAYFRVLASDANCGSQLSNIVTLTVLDQVVKPVVGSEQTICLNTTPAQLTSTRPTGGNNIFVYQWQKKEKQEWTDIPETNALAYQPGNLADTTSYRVIATDNGIRTCCGSFFSNEIKICVMAATLPGSLSADQHIVPGSTPAVITSLTPGSGSGTISYTWESTINSGSSWSGLTGETGLDYAPGPISQLTWIRRITYATSGTTVCSSGTQPVKITMNTSGIDQTELMANGLEAYQANRFEIVVKGEVHQPATATLYDIQGRMILVENLEEGNLNIIRTPGLKTGIYILFVKNSDKLHRLKIPVRE